MPAISALWAVSQRAAPHASEPAVSSYGGAPQQCFGHAPVALDGPR